MNKMKKIAYIYHNFDGEISSIQLAMVLFERCYEVIVAKTLEQFEGKHNLNEFSVLLYHPGKDQQHLIPVVQKKYPKLLLALFSDFSEDYSGKEDGGIYFFS